MSEQRNSNAAECAMCGGTGGWPGVNGWVVCKPCDGTGQTTAPVGPTHDEALNHQKVH